MNQEYPDYFESNLSLLEKYHPQTWKQITENPPEPLGNVFFTPDGKPNLIVMSDQGNSVIMHNETDPEKDSNNFISRIPSDYQGFVGILGMGLGYGVSNILKERPMVQWLAVFDLEPGIFVQALRYTDFSDLFKNPRLILRIGTRTPINEALAPADNAIKLEHSFILHHLQSFNSHLDAYEQLKSDLFSYVNAMNIEGTTVKFLGKSFIDNRFKHISTIHHHHIIDQLENIFRDKPAILVAGGPSLDKNIHLLKQVTDKAVIFAADTVLPALLNHGISPHFVTSIDPNNLTFEKFAHVVSKTKDTSLICSASVNLKTAKIMPAKKIFWTFKANSIESWLNHFLGGRLNTGGASTVAHLNLIAAEILGCNPITLIGQDLAYPGTASHAKGTVLHGAAPSELKGSGSETEVTMGIDGQMVRTDRGFLSMKRHFENMIQSSSKKFINATEGGAHIEGTEILKLQEVINTYCTETIHTNHYLEDHYKKITPAMTENLFREFQSLLKIIQSARKKIKQSDVIADSLLKTLNKQKKGRTIVKSFNMLSPSQQKQIIKLDQLHAALDNTEKVWHILEEITMEGLKKSERQKLAIAHLEKDPSRYMEWLVKNLNRLIEINSVRNECLNTLVQNIEMIFSFRQQEQIFNENIDEGKNPAENRMNLARLYISSDDYCLARPLLDQLRSDLPGSGEVYYLSGCTALQSNEFPEADLFFKRAMELEHGLSEQIKDYRSKIGDEFLSFVRHFQRVTTRDASIKYTISKGLLFCPFHAGLKNELISILNRDLNKTETLLKASDYSQAKMLIQDWHERITNNAHLLDCIPEEPLTGIFLNEAKLQLYERDYPKAIESLNTALKYSPDEHDIYFMLIDTYFVAEDYTNGIAILNQAVAVDVKFAGYWETIGDQLQEAGQQDDAILAYEKCFYYQPENILLLKKIGDCYMAMDQLEAAKAAYEHLQSKLSSNKSEQT